MKVSIVAVGRLRSGPEAEIVSDYRQRFERTGRALGFSALDIVEVEAKKGGMAAEGEALLRALSAHSPICTLDERGKSLTSPQFSDLIAGWRDEGGLSPAFVIGGADGLSHDLQQAADLSINLGKMVWPHMLVRVMLVEQLYRAASILAGSPYHRA